MDSGQGVTINGQSERSLSGAAQSGKGLSNGQCGQLVGNGQSEKGLRIDGQCG